MVVRPLLIVAAVVLACAPAGRERFIERNATLECKQRKRCNSSAFEQSYASVAECAEQRERGIRQRGLGCEYDTGEAAECLRQLRSGCGEATACYGVFHPCSGSIDGGGGTSG